MDSFDATKIVKQSHDTAFSIPVSPLIMTSMSSHKVKKKYTLQQIGRPDKYTFSNFTQWLVCFSQIRVVRTILARKSWKFRREVK